MPMKMRRAAKQHGLEALMASFRCDADVADMFDVGALFQLWGMWNKVRSDSK